jgi:fibronectin type 3 domain-containing protein
VGYDVFRGTANGGPYQMIDTLDASTTYTDGTVVSGTTYYYVVTAVNAEGQQSPYSNVAQAVIPGS